MTYDLDVSYGTEENWKYALEKIGTNTWLEFADNEYINHKKLSYYFPKYSSLSENEKWLYFITLKLFGCEEEPQGRIVPRHYREQENRQRRG